MGLFSSSSKSSSSYKDESRNTSGTVGDLSSDNVIVTGDYTYSIDGLNQQMADTYINAIKDFAGSAISQTADAYSGANASIVATSDNTRSFLNSLQPIVLIVAGAVAVWAIFTGGK